MRALPKSAFSMTTNEIIGAAGVLITFVMIGGVAGLVVRSMK